jgi:hypothetical protein
MAIIMEDVVVWMYKSDTEKRLLRARIFKFNWSNNYSLVLTTAGTVLLASKSSVPTSSKGTA